MVLKIMLGILIILLVVVCVLLNRGLEYMFGIAQNQVGAANILRDILKAIRANGLL